MINRRANHDGEIIIDVQQQEVERLEQELKELQNTIDFHSEQLQRLEFHKIDKDPTAPKTELQQQSEQLGELQQQYDTGVSCLMLFSLL